MIKFLMPILVAFLTGCAAMQNLNPFDRPAPPLPGERREVQLKNYTPDRSVPQPFSASEAARLPPPEPTVEKKK